MVKILLVVEEFNTSVNIETLLKKLGFDTLGISQELALAEQLVSFCPDVVIAAGSGKRVDAYSVAKRIKKQRLQPKVLLVLPSGRKLSSHQILEAKVDGVLHFPLQTDRLIKALAKMTKMEEQTLLNKFNRTPKQNQQVVKPVFEVKNTSQKVETEENNQFQDFQRREKYTKFLQGIEKPEQTSFAKGQARDLMKEHKKEWNSEQLVELDEERKKFVKALYEKDEG